MNTSVSPVIPSLYDFTLNDIAGQPVSLSQYRGKVLLIVNVASRCGFTKQYAALQALYERYVDRGLVVLGFPANNFLGQEPGSEAEIHQFCSLNYGVTFPMFAKISVKGKEIHPLYRFLTDKKLHPRHGGSIGWNFAKFLVARDGRILDRFMPITPPDAPRLVKAIEQALGTEVDRVDQS